MPQTTPYERSSKSHLNLNYNSFVISTLVSSEQTPLFLSEGGFWTIFQLETGGSAYKKYLLQRFNVRRVTGLDFLPWAITMAPLCSGVASDQVLPAGPRPGACWQPRTWVAQQGSWSQGGWSEKKNQSVGVHSCFTGINVFARGCFVGTLFPWGTI